MRTRAVMCPALVADRFRIVAVVLAALDERLDVPRRDQPHLVAQGLRDPAPVMGAAARFQHQLGGRALAQELEPDPAQDRATPPIHPVQGEDGLGGIDGDALALHGGRLPWTLWRRVTRRGSSRLTPVLHPLLP